MIIDNYIFNLEDMCDNLGRKIANAYPYKYKNKNKNLWIILSEEMKIN